MCGWRSKASVPVEFYGRVGGNVPSVEELLAKIEEQIAQQCEHELRTHRWRLTARGRHGRRCEERSLEERGSSRRIRSRPRQVARRSTTSTSAKSDLQAPDALLPGLRPRHRAQADRRSHRRTGPAGPHHLRQPGGLLGVRLLLLRCGQRAGRARTRPGRRHRPEARLPGQDRDLPTRATATSPPSAPPRSFTPPTAAKRSPSSSSTTRSTA